MKFEPQNRSRSFGEAQTWKKRQQRHRDFPIGLASSGDRHNHRQSNAPCILGGKGNKKLSGN